MEGPEIVMTKTPLRISFLGGGSDLPFYTDTGRIGCVISTTIDKYVYVTVRRRKDSKIVAFYSQREEVPSVDELKNEYIAQALHHTGLSGGLDIYSMSDARLVRTGLGGSSAFLVGLLLAVRTLQGIDLRPIELGEIAFHVETNLIGKKIGRQDHYAAACGGFRAYYFGRGLGKQEATTEQLFQDNFPMDKLLLLYANCERRDDNPIFDSIHSDSNRKCSLAMYEVLAMLAKKGRKYALQQDWNRFFSLLRDAWIAKRGSSPLISNPGIDAMHLEVIAAGAKCGKLIGAGGGGYMLFYCPDGKEGVLDNLKGKYQELNFSLSSKRSEVLFCQ